MVEIPTKKWHTPQGLQVKPRLKKEETGQTD